MLDTAQICSSTPAVPPAWGCSHARPDTLVIPTPVPAQTHIHMHSNALHIALSPMHTHAVVYAYTHAHMCTCPGSCTLTVFLGIYTLTPAHTYTRDPVFLYQCSHPQAHPHICPLTHIPSNTLKCLLEHSHVLLHTHTSFYALTHAHA